MFHECSLLNAPWIFQIWKTMHRLQFFRFSDEQKYYKEKIDAKKWDAITRKDKEIPHKCALFSASMNLMIEREQHKVAALKSRRTLCKVESM